MSTHYFVFQLEKSPGKCLLCRQNLSPPADLVILTDVSVVPALEAVYCVECYRHLLVEAGEHIPKLPRLEDTKFLPKKPIPVPGYLVKEGNPLLMFHPRDVTSGDARCRCTRRR